MRITMVSVILVNSVVIQSTQASRLVIGTNELRRPTISARITATIRPDSHEPTYALQQSGKFPFTPLAIYSRSETLSPS